MIRAILGVLLVAVIITVAGAVTGVIAWAASLALAPKGWDPDPEFMQWWMWALCGAVIGFGIWLKMLGNATADGLLRIIIPRRKRKT